MQKKVSIILPTYNGGDRIGKSIKSVQDQSFQDWELIIVIDGSTDATFERVSRIAKQDSRIVIINNEQNQGIQKTLNDGLKKATGEYIARIDDDDVWVDVRKLQKQIDFLEQNPDYVLVGTGIILVDKNGKQIDQYLFSASDDEIRKKILGQNCFAHPTVLFRNDIVKKIGGYSEDMNHKHVEDHELWLRMGTIGKMGNIPEYAILYQVNEQGLSGKNKSVQLKRRVQLCITYRKKYPNFLKNVIKITFLYIGYITIGWMFAGSIKVRSKLTAIYKELF